MSAVVRRDQVTLGGILGPREVVGRDPPGPLVLVGPPGDRLGAVAGAPDRVEARALVADRAVHIGIDEVLARATDPQGGRAELLEGGGADRLERDRGPDRVLTARPSHRVGALDGQVRRVEQTERLVVDHGAVPRLADRDDPRFGFAAHQDRLVAGEDDRVVALLVEVLHVTAHVRHAPGVVRGSPQDHPGAEDEGHAACVEVRRPQVDREPRTRLDREEVRVVREERLPARGA